MPIIFAILSTTSIFVGFKYLEKFKIDFLPAIVVNYAIASACGFLLTDHGLAFEGSAGVGWAGLSVLLGAVFVFVLFVIGKSTQKAGIATTTLANKMSFVVPILFSVLYYHEEVFLQKYLGFLAAVASVVFSAYKDQKSKAGKKHLWLPFVLFVGAGIMDSLLKYTQDRYLGNGGIEQFSSFLFATASIVGLLALSLKKEKLVRLFHIKTIIGGILLGLANFGSLYFLLASLNSSGFDSSIVFSMVNIGVVSLSVASGLFFFGEKLNKINLLGIVMAFIAIFILAN